MSSESMCISRRTNVSVGSASGSETATVAGRPVSITLRVVG